MTHHETESPETSGTHCDRCAADISRAAYVLGAAVLLGAALVAFSVFFNVKTVLTRLDGGVINTVANTQQQAAPQQQAQQQQQKPAGPVDIKLAPGTPFLGSASAKVTVVEYADYRCPFCERWYTSVFKELKTKYIDTGKIKFVFQDFAFLGPDSNTASEASHCAADQNKFWQYHDYLFNNQGEESSDWASAANQKKFAQTLGLNMTQFNQCLDSGKYKQAVVDETAAGKSYGVSGTPTVFINGVAIVGAQPLANFTQAIDAALNK